MGIRQRYYFIIGLLIITLLIAIARLYPYGFFPARQKPQPHPAEPYPYYQIIDDASGKTLMYVPLKVAVGDELVCEENKRYQVVRIEENRAYARFVENINIEKYKSVP